MFDTPTAYGAPDVLRSQLLGLATAAQQALDPDEPAEFWYRQGVRDAYAYAAALQVTGHVGEPTQAAALRVIRLLGEEVTDLGVLLAATEASPQRAAQPTWVGPLAFHRLTARHPGIDHDLGAGWGERGDIRIRHRRRHDDTVGLLYAYDPTWDEYAILDPAAPVDVVARTARAAVETDPHLTVADFLALLRTNMLAPGAQPEAPAVQL